MNSQSNLHPDVGGLRLWPSSLILSLYFARRRGCKLMSTDGEKMNQQYEWIFVGKGIAILLVVILHVGDWVQLNLDYESALYQISDKLRPLRMPLFFAISGILAAFSFSSGGFNSIFRKCLNIYFVMVVWAAFVLLKAVVSDVDVGKGWFDYALFVLVKPHYWYLSALLIFSIVMSLAYAVGEKSKFLMILFGLVLHFYAKEIGGLVENDSYGAFAQYKVEFAARNFVWFVVGCYCSKFLVSINESVSGKLLFLSLMCSLVFVAVSWNYQNIEWVFLLASASWLALSFIALPRIDHFRISKLFSYLGRRTLSIYVLHLHVLVFPKILIMSGVPFSGGEGMVVMLSVFSVMSCVMIEYLMRSGGFGVIFDGPIKKTTNIEGLFSRAKLLPNYFRR